MAERRQMESRRAKLAGAVRKLRESMFPHLRERTVESGHPGGSDEIRGKNKKGQLRAMWYKDPENPYAD